MYIFYTMLLLLAISLANKYYNKRVLITSYPCSSFVLHLIFPFAAVKY